MIVSVHWKEAKREAHIWRLPLRSWTTTHAQQLDAELTIITSTKGKRRSFTAYHASIPAPQSGECWMSRVKFVPSPLGSTMSPRKLHHACAMKPIAICSPAPCTTPLAFIVYSRNAPPATPRSSGVYCKANLQIRIYIFRSKYMQ